MRKRSSEIPNNTFPIVDEIALAKYFFSENTYTLSIRGISYETNYSRRLLEFALAQAKGNFAVAEDALQETFIQCLKAIRHSNKSIDCYSYFTTIIIGKVFDLFKRSKNEVSLGEWEGSTWGGLDKINIIDEKQHRIFITALRRLDPLHCMILLLQFCFEMKPAEMVAEINSFTVTEAQPRVTIEDLLEILFEESASLATIPVEIVDIILQNSAIMAIQRKADTEKAHITSERMENLIVRAKASFNKHLTILGYFLLEGVASSVPKLPKQKSTKPIPQEKDLEPAELVLA